MNTNNHQMSRVAIVTGATSGIGVVIAERLVNDGFKVVLVGRSQARGNAVAERLGNDAHFVQADLTDSNAAEAVVAAAHEKFLRIDVLVNNAAVDHTNELVSVTEDEIRRTLDSNVIAPIQLTIAVATFLKKQGTGGAIVNITSRLASIGVPTLGIYSASKGAISSFTRAAAIEWASDKIRVNDVAPGLTRTPLYEAWISGLEDPEGEEVQLASKIPLGRIAEPTDVAAAVSFLASSDASYITGTSIPVEGGFLAQ